MMRILVNFYILFWKGAIYMLHRFKYVTLILMLLTIGCVAPEINMTNPDGETTPKPFYRATTTDGTQLRFTWFYEDLKK